MTLIVRVTSQGIGADAERNIDEEGLRAKLGDPNTPASAKVAIIRTLAGYAADFARHTIETALEDMYDVEVAPAGGGEDRGVREPGEGKGAGGPQTVGGR